MTSQYKAMQEKLSKRRMNLEQTVEENEKIIEQKEKLLDDMEKER